MRIIFILFLTLLMMSCGTIHKVYFNGKKTLEVVYEEHDTIGPKRAFYIKKKGEKRFDFVFVRKNHYVDYTDEIIKIKYLQ